MAKNIMYYTKIFYKATLHMSKRLFSKKIILSVLHAIKKTTTKKSILEAKWLVVV